MKVTGVQVKHAMISNGITRVPHHTCGCCLETVAYVRVNESLFFDSSCACSWSEPSPRAWDSAADWINMQSNPEIQTELASRFGIDIKTEEKDAPSVSHLVEYQGKFIDFAVHYLEFPHDSDVPPSVGAVLAGKSPRALDSHGLVAASLYMLLCFPNSKVVFVQQKHPLSKGKFEDFKSYFLHIYEHLKAHKKNVPELVTPQIIERAYHKGREELLAGFREKAVLFVMFGVQTQKAVEVVNCSCMAEHNYVAEADYV